MRILIVRLGAYGDTIITTPLIRWLKKKGHDIYYMTQDQGRDLLENNPHIEKLIFYKRNSVPSDKLLEHFVTIQKIYGCDKIIDLCESIEVNLCLHPSDPRYKFTKYEKIEMCNKNYYEETFRIAYKQLQEPFICNPNMYQEMYNPEFFPTSTEEKYIKEDLVEPYFGKTRILWGLSGSSRQKTYPTEQMVYIMKAFPDCVHITVGGEVEQVLEWGLKKQEGIELVCRAGIYSMRESITACKYVDIVVSPDTGLLHGVGCYNTPKIGLFTNTTKENISKHFINDFSLEAEPIGCIPCMSLIYSSQCQCNLTNEGTPFCMAYGFQPDLLIRRIKEALKCQKTN